MCGLNSVRNSRPGTESLNCWEVIITIKPIETYYNGYRFRSRLEARWAVFFDAMGVEYEYEPEGFDLGDGIYYLPDFYLPEQNYYVEVKGNMTEGDKKKIEKFVDSLFDEDGCYDSAQYKFIVLGNIPPYRGDILDWVTDRYINNFDGYSVLFDCPYLPCVCPICGKFGFEYEGRGGRVCGNKCTSDDHGLTYDHPRILFAYDAARQARFEHGEQYA